MYSPLQAQTVANFYLAFEQNLAIVPVLNKCDMRTAEPDAVAEQMQQVRRLFTFISPVLFSFANSVIPSGHELFVSLEVPQGASWWYRPAKCHAMTKPDQDSSL